MSKFIDIHTFEDIRDELYSCIKFISEEQIPYLYWHEALPIVRDTDLDDIAFVVLAEYLDAKLWTGDKKLHSGLEKRGYSRIISTEYLSNIKFKDE